MGLKTGKVRCFAGKCGWPRVLALGAVAILAISCRNSPAVIRSFRSPSPDGRWEAVVERVDNGMGFGLGALYDEVHLVESGKSVSQHGESCASVLFYRNASADADLTTQVAWIDARHLQVTHPANPKPGRAQAECQSLSVTYIPVTRTPTVVSPKGKNAQP